MDEYSRIVIEEYCSSQNSKKSDPLSRLVDKSYDLSFQASDSDGMFLEKAIRSEKDPLLKKALIDLDDFLMI